MPDASDNNLELDPKLQSNPHYWLYKVTRDALDNENHPLHDMGHIWNRWIDCQRIEREYNEIGQLENSPTRNEKIKIINFIKENENKNWGFPNFSDKINFSYITWEKEVNFSEFIFHQETTFHETKFLGNANFKHSKFKKNADFWGATFCETVDFSKSEFTGNMVKFNECKFFKPTNQNTEFDFKNTIFNSTVNFSESEFHHLPNLTGTDFRGGVNLDKVVFLKSPPPLGEGWVGDTIKESVTASPPPNLPQRGRDNSDILGGLPPKDAAVTWHALSTEMEKAGYHDQSLEYFGYELEAKRLNPETGGFFRFILGAYKNISDYGKSLARPFMAWCFLICAFFSIYSPIIFSNTKTLLLLPYTLRLSLKGAFPFVSDQTGFFDRIFGGKNNHLISDNNYLELGIFPLLYGVHTLLSLILIFLFGLGVRNRLRLK